MRPGVCVGRSPGDVGGAGLVCRCVTASWTSLLSNEAITQMVGHEAFARALVYARSGHVHDVELDDEAMVISGRVKGTYRDDYAVTRPPGQLPLRRGHARTAASAPARS